MINIPGTLTEKFNFTEHGVPIREGGEDVARFPAGAIPVRRRDG